jgi:hypothetical protein
MAEDPESGTRFTALEIHENMDEKQWRSYQRGMRSLARA